MTMTHTAEPAWLAGRRRAAKELHETLPFPTRTDEEWRRTELKGLSEAAAAAGPGPDPEVQSQPAGINITPLAAAPEDLLFSTVGPQRDRFSALHVAYCNGAVVV